MQLVISSQVRKDITQIYKYISKDSVKYANETVNNIYARINVLSKFLHIARYVLEVPNKTLREILYKSYRIVYSISEEKQLVHILFVAHGKQDFKKFSNKYKITK